MAVTAGSLSVLTTAIQNWNQVNPNQYIDANKYVNEVVTLINSSTTFQSEVQQLLASGTLNVALPSPSTPSNYAVTNASGITITLPTLGSTNTLDANAPVDNAAVFCGTLAHELGHYFDSYRSGARDEATYLTQQFISEGKATYNNMQIDEEILHNPSLTSTGINVPLDTLNAQNLYNYISSNGLDQDDAILYIASQYSTIHTSTPGNPTYATYYQSSIPVGVAIEPKLSNSQIKSLTFTNVANTNAANAIAVAATMSDGSTINLQVLGYRGLVNLSGSGGGTAFVGPVANPAPSGSGTQNNAVDLTNDTTQDLTIIGDPLDTNTFTAGSANVTFIGNSENTNVFYGTKDSSSPIKDIMIGDDISSAQDKSDTFYAGAGSNVIIGGNGTNNIEFDASTNPWANGVIWDNGGTSNINFEGSVNVVVLQIQSPDLQQIADLAASSLPPGTVILVNPNSNDTISLDGTQLVGAHYGVAYDDNYPGVVDSKLYGYLSNDGRGVNQITYQDGVTDFGSVTEDGLESISGTANIVDVGDSKSEIQFKGLSNGEFGIGFSGSGVAFVKTWADGTISQEGSVGEIGAIDSSNVNSAAAADAATPNLSSSSDNEYLLGGNPASTITVSNSNDVIVGAEKGNQVNIQGNSNSFYGNAGTDVVVVNGNENTLQAGWGNSTFTVAGDTNTINGSTGILALSVNGDHTSFYGDEGQANLNVTGNGSIIRSGSDSETIAVTGNFTVAYGGPGSILAKVEGSDTSFYGNTGFDNLVFDGDDNIVVGGQNFDQIEINGNASSVWSGSGYSEVKINGDYNQLEGNGDESVSIVGDKNSFVSNEGYSQLFIDGHGNYFSGGTESTNYVVYGGSGNTFLPGQAWDTLDYSADPTSVSIDLTQGTASFTGKMLQDTIGALPSITIGSNSSIISDDMTRNLFITGNDSTLDGGAGNSNLMATGDDDTLLSGNGGGFITAQGNSDTLTGSAAYTVLAATGSDNTLTGGTGPNTFTITGNSNVLTGGGGYELVQVSGNQNVVDTKDSNTDLTVAGDANTLTGGSDYTTFTVQGSHNVLTGGAQTTMFNVEAGSGNTFHAGSGWSILDYSANTTPVQVNLANGTAAFAGSTGVDVIDSIPAVTIGSNSSIISGSTWTSMTAAGNNSTLQGGSGGDYMAASGNGDTLAAGSGGGDLSATGSNDVYLLGRGDWNETIQNGNGGGEASSNQLSFVSGVSSQQLWLAQSGNDLQLEILGSGSTITVQNWFSDTASQIKEIVGTDGFELDSGVNNLVQAMTAYMSSHPAFNPAIAGAMPTDPTLQSAVTAAWHH